LNLLLLFFGREYRLHRLPSLFGFALIILQVPLFVLLIKHWPQLAGLLTLHLVDVRVLPSSIVPQPVLFLQAAVALFFLAMALIDRKPVSSGFFWLLLASVYGLQYAETTAGRTLCFTAAGLIVITTLLESVYAMAFRDELTGLPGRRALNSAFLGLSGNYAMAMVDIDFFKKFNDRFGHDVGDEVLRMVAAKLDRVEGGGRAFRYGGEEFSILFAGRTKKEVLPHLERLRQTVSEAGFVLRRKSRPRRKPRRKNSARRPIVQTVSVTISIGVADSVMGGKTARIIKAADRALYRAKKKGRNRVEEEGN
jgi:diguanylate cyclase (GGDEF)-like protein